MIGLVAGTRISMVAGVTDMRRGFVGLSGMVQTALNEVMWSSIIHMELLAPVEDWGKLLGDSAAVNAKLDRLLRHGHPKMRPPQSWRTKTDLPDQEKMG
jgi:hypothetical protein